MPERSSVLFTIGHSTQSLENFLKLLKKHSVTAIADVRSQPYSRNEHFSRKPLETALKAEGIEYVFLGRELGARRDEPECYVEGHAAYERIAKLPAFEKGLTRLRRGMESQVVAIMCAEKEPLDCHRTILICRQLCRCGVGIQHILADGGIEEHAETERRLVREMRIQPNLFESDNSDSQLVERAYEKRGREIADRTNSEEVSP